MWHLFHTCRISKKDEAQQQVFRTQSRASDKANPAQIALFILM